ncbi:MAG: T9SS type A sorting domain-containing protein [Duncaniella sp.]|nr:T9SS type A sorting domain-containing protein [Duncaniella sp.]
MKKFYLLGGMAAATALIAAAATYSATSNLNDAAPQADESAAATVPYYSAAAATYSQIAEGWTVINANADNKTFEPTSESSSPTGTAMKISWSASNVQQDDYLIAPAVHLTAGTEYKIGYTWKTGSDNENVTFYMSQSVSPEEIKASAVLCNHENYKLTTFTKDWDSFIPTEDGDYHFAVYVHSPGYRYYVYFADLTIVENKFTPASATGLKATPGANRELSCKLEWTLPTTDVFGEALPDDKPVSAVKVYRDGEEIENVNLDATATEFTDTEETGLTSGYHVYGVKVVAGGVESALAEVGPTAYVGPIAPFDLPATFAINSADNYDLWTKVNDSKTWTYDSSYGAKYAVANNSAIDNWLITPPLTIVEDGYYRITVTAFSTTTDETSFEVCLLSSTDTETAEKIVVNDNWSLGQAYASSSSVKPVVSFDFKLSDSAGTYYVGFHNKSEKSSYASLYFMNVSVEKTSFVPSPVENVTAVPAADYSNAIEVSWENPTTSLTGDEINTADYQIEIYLNDSKTPAAMVDGDKTSATVAVAEPGIYTVTVKTVSTDEDNGTAPNPPAVTTAWVGSHEVKVPYTTTFANDDATVAIWEIVDGNNDGNTFSHNVTSYSHDMGLSKSAKEFKDYLLSPHMVLDPGYYKVTVEHGASSSTTVTPVLGVITAGTFDAENVELLSSAEFTLNSWSSETDDFIFEVKEKGSFQIVYGLEQTFSTNYSGLKLISMDVQTTEVLPGDVTELTATISGDDNDTVELSWINPATMFNSQIPMSSVDKLVILRDNEELTTITEGLTPGEAASYSDTEVPAGPHTYTVKVLNAEGKAHTGSFPSVTTDWVGGGQSAPVDLKTSDGQFPGWSFFDADGDHGSYTGMYTWKYSMQKYMIEGVNNTNDDYLVSAPLKINENEIYEVTYFMSAPSSGNPSDMDVDVKIGSLTDDPTAYTTVHTINLPAELGFKNHSFYLAIGSPDESEPQSAPRRVIAKADDATSAADLYAQAAKIPAAGDFKVALHAKEKGGIQMSEFHFAKAADYNPGSTTSIDNAEVVGVSFDGHAVHFAGRADVTVYDLTGTVVAAAADAEGVVALDDIATGCYIVKVATPAATHTLKVVK